MNKVSELSDDLEAVSVVLGGLMWLVNLVRPSKIQNNLSRLSLI